MWPPATWSSISLAIACRQAYMGQARCVHEPPSRHQWLAYAGAESLCGGRSHAQHASSLVGCSHVHCNDRSGRCTQRVVLDDGSAETQRPLTVLINGGSASASEILAGALHDAGRASLVGDRTFGKGKIQSVFELRDGSALFVTVARYTSASAQVTDHSGLCTIFYGAAIGSLIQGPKRHAHRHLLLWLAFLIFKLHS